MRVENPIHLGTPDVNCCADGVEFWVELKRVESFPKLASTPVFTGCLKPEQVLWHHARSRAGGVSYIVGLVESEDKVYVVPGKYSMEFNSMTREKLDSLTLKLEDMWTTG